VQLTAALAEPAHAHLASAYLVRCGRGGTLLRVAHGGRDRTRMHSPKQQVDACCMLQTSISSVSNVLEVCCKCFISMLQKYTEMLHMLQWCFQAYVPNVLSISDVYCKRFIWMLQSRSECCIYMHVANVCFKCFRCFLRML
jgi:hypothetical protein